MRQTNEGVHEAGQGNSQILRLVTLAAFLFFPASELTANTCSDKLEAKPAAAQSQSVTANTDRPARRIVISLPDRKLALIEGDRVVKVFPVAVGARVAPSPSGKFTIANRIPQPTYYAPGKVIPPGPENPLGPRWMGLSLKGFGIHGTNEPHSIGKRASHGCIRMRNSDVKELFELMRVGDAVELHGARTVEVAQIFGAPESAKPKAQPQPVPVVVAVAVP